MESRRLRNTYPEASEDGVRRVEVARCFRMFPRQSGVCLLFWTVIVRSRIGGGLLRLGRCPAVTFSVATVTEGLPNVFELPNRASGDH